jgi:hypothetical protein
VEPSDVKERKKETAAQRVEWWLEEESGTLQAALIGSLLRFGSDIVILRVCGIFPYFLSRSSLK